MNHRLSFRHFLALLTLPAALLLCRCDRGPTFACDEGADDEIQCKLGSEVCLIQDSGGGGIPTCVPFPASCDPADLCSCTDLIECPSGEHPDLCDGTSRSGYTFQCAG